MTGGGKQYPNACTSEPGNLETSCASTSTPEEPSQSYCENNGNARELPGMHCTDDVDAMRAILNGSRSSQTRQKALGRNRMIESRDGREIASATLLEAVGIHFSVNMNPCSTCNSKSCTNSACVAGSVARPLVNPPTTDWLSTWTNTCARRKPSGYLVQNCRNTWYRAYISLMLICLDTQCCVNTPPARNGPELALTTPPHPMDDASVAPPVTLGETWRIYRMYTSHSSICDCCSGCVGVINTRRKFVVAFSVIIIGINH